MEGGSEAVGSGGGRGRVDGAAGDSFELVVGEGGGLVEGECAQALGVQSAGDGTGLLF